MIVLDTNVLSELVRPEPDSGVLAWFESTRGQHTTTTICIAELSYGVEKLPSGRRKAVLDAALNSVIHGLDHELLKFDEVAARIFGVMFASRERSGRPMELVDGQIAAICRVHDVTLATRNVRDFVDLEIRLINPWQL